MRKIIITLLTAVLLFSTFTSSACAEADISFSDVKKGDWFYSNVIKMADLGILNGYLDGTFKPDNTLKFEEFIKMLITATEKEKIEVLQGENWYQNYIDIALEKNYITNDMTKLIGANVDRKAMAEIIYNFMTSSGEDMDKLNEKEMAFLADKFSDLKASNIKTLYIAYMGIINGYPDKTFKPGNSLKRCEATTVILRIIDKGIRTPIEIVLPKTLADFPTPDLNYLYNYSTLRGVTAKEDYEFWLSRETVEPFKQTVDTNTNFIELLVNRDYRTINEPRTLKFYDGAFYGFDWQEKNVCQKTLSYKDWLLYYTNASQEYCGKEYYSLRNNFLRNNPNYTQAEVDKEIDYWFENFQDKFINDTINNQVIVQGKFYTADDLYVWVDGSFATRGILRFKFDSHNDPSNIKEELNLVMREVVNIGKRSVESEKLGDAWNIYFDYSDIGDIKVGQWYEIAMDIVISQDGSHSGIEIIKEIIDGKSEYGFGYIYPIYIKELN